MAGENGNGVVCGEGTTLVVENGVSRCVPVEANAWTQPETYMGLAQNDPLMGLLGGLFGGTPANDPPAAAGGGDIQTGSAVPDWAIYSGLGLAVVGIILVVATR